MNYDFCYFDPFLYISSLDLVTMTLKEIYTLSRYDPVFADISIDFIETDHETLEKTKTSSKAKLNTILCDSCNVEIRDKKILCLTYRERNDRKISRALCSNCCSSVYSEIPRVEHNRYVEFVELFRLNKGREVDKKLITPLIALSYILYFQDQSEKVREKIEKENINVVFPKAFAFMKEKGIDLEIGLTDEKMNTFFKQ